MPKLDQRAKVASDIRGVFKNSTLEGHRCAQSALRPSTQYENQQRLGASEHETQAPHPSRKDLSQRSLLLRLDSALLREIDEDGETGKWFNPILQKKLRSQP